MLRFDPYLTIEQAARFAELARKANKVDWINLLSSLPAYTLDELQHWLNDLNADTKL